MASKGGYKKVLFKKLSGLTILLIILVLGVFAVIFNKFYLSPRAMLYQGDGGSSTCEVRKQCSANKCINGWLYECKTYGYKTAYGPPCIYLGLFQTAKRCK